MTTKKLNIFVIIFILLKPGINWSQSIDSAAITGTYHAYVRVYRAMVTNYVRIRYLSDSSFAFTMTGDAAGSPEKNNILLQFNNASFYQGIARKVKYQGKPAWVGVIEDYQASFEKDTGYFNPDMVITDIRKLLDTTLRSPAFMKKYGTYNHYDLIQFSFPSPGKSVDIRMVPFRLFDFADLFMESMDGEYQKSDNRPMEFPHSYYVINKFIGVIKAKVVARQLPIPDLVAGNKPVAVFLPGTIVYISTPPYQQYILVTLYDKNFHILHQGWVRMDAIRGLHVTAIFPPTTKYIYDIR